MIKTIICTGLHVCACTFIKIHNMLVCTFLSLRRCDTHLIALTTIQYIKDIYEGIHPYCDAMRFDTTWRNASLNMLSTCTTLGHWQQWSGGLEMRQRTWETPELRGDQSEYKIISQRILVRFLNNKVIGSLLIIVYECNPDCALLPTPVDGAGQVQKCSPFFSPDSPVTCPALLIHTPPHWLTHRNSSRCDTAPCVGILVMVRKVQLLQSQSGWLMCSKRTCW